MKNYLLFGFAGLLLAVSFWWVFVADPGRIPILDFNRQVLAETEQEGWCAGNVYWESQGRGNEKMAKACRASNPGLSTAVDHSVVILSFCMGAKEAGFTGDVLSQCAEPIAGARLWPTMAGGLTSSFDESKGYPYPGDRVLAPPPDDSRTGTRDGFSRGDKPPETTTTTEGEG